MLVRAHTMAWPETRAALSKAYMRYTCAAKVHRTYAAVHLGTKGGGKEQGRCDP